jgi:hypothetical protein
MRMSAQPAVGGTTVEFTPTARFRKATGRVKISSALGPGAEALKRYIGLRPSSSTLERFNANFQSKPDFRIARTERLR